MKKCPICNKETIPLKWVLLNKSENEKKYCFECTNCNSKIKKEKIFIFQILTVGIIEGTLLFLVAMLLDSFFNHLLYSFLVSVILFTIAHFSIEYSATLTIADENYCIGGMTRVDAFLALVLMVIIISATIYYLLIEPFM